MNTSTIPMNSSDGSVICRQGRGRVWIDMIIWTYIFHVLALVVAEIEVIVIGITKGWPKTVYQ
jgi:hypothetical protein